jgi:hypothetical protein
VIAFTHPQLQRVLDAFSVGTLRKFELRDQPLAWSRKIKVTPETSLGQANDFAGQVFRVETTHDTYWLFGFSENGNNLSEADVGQILETEFETSFATIFKTTSNLFTTHKFDHHWWLVLPHQNLSDSEVTQKLSLLNNQPIAIEVGYGGMLFAEIGNLQPRKYQPHRWSGSFRLYSNEFWEVRLAGKKITDRWSETADLLEKLNSPILERITFSSRNKRTHFHLSTGHELIIHRQESLRSWEIDSNLEKWAVLLLGTGHFILRDYLPTKETRIKKRRQSVADPIGDEFYKEDLPISPDLVKKIFRSLQGSEVLNIDQYSGISFSLDLGGKRRFSVNCHWRLENKTGQTVLNSHDQAFTFMDELLAHLKGTTIEELTFTKGLDETKMVFASGLTLILPKEKRYTLWTMFNSYEGYYVDARGDGTLTHIIIVPNHLQEHYSYVEKGSKLASVLYALDLYRKWVKLA